jgi:two-component system, NarL family, sensor kinase
LRTQRSAATASSEPAVPSAHALPSDDITSSAYLIALIENSPVAIVVLDSSHRFAMCNAAFETLFQYSQQELRQAAIDSLISSDAMREEAGANTRRVLAGEKVHTLTRRRRKDGSLIDVELYGVPLMVEGHLRGVYGLYQDVTERNRAERTVRELSSRLLHLQDEERRRIARDLHDNTAQQLAAINLNLRALQNISSDEKARRLLEDTARLVDECSREVRSISYLLHPPLLSEAGLRPALNWLAEGFEKRSGIKVRVDVSPALERLSEDSETALFRVAQEGLSNALRHSGTPEVHVQLRQDSTHVILRISDKGRGIAPPDRQHKHLGVGIQGMKERLAQLGGQLNITSSSNGTVVTATVPMEESNHVNSAHHRG